MKCLEEIEKEAKPENIAITMGYVGQVAPNFGIDNMVLFMRGPDDGQLRVAQRTAPESGLPSSASGCVKCFPERLTPWLHKRLEKGGLASDEARASPGR